MAAMQITSDIENKLGNSELVNNKAETLLSPLE